MCRKIKLIYVIVTVVMVILLLISIGVFKVYADSKQKCREKVELGNKYLTENKYEEAIVVFEEAIRIDKNNVDARIGASKAYMAIEEFHKAEVVLLDGIRQTSKVADLYLALSKLYLDEFKFEKAIEILDDGCSKSKDFRLSGLLKDIGDSLAIVINEPRVQVYDSTGVKLIEKASGRIVKAKWSTRDSYIGTIWENSQGDETYSSKSIGKNTISAKVGSIVKNADIQVLEHVVKSIEIVSLPKEARVGDKIEIESLLKDVNGKQVSMDIQWDCTGGIKLSSNSTISNTISCIEPGKATVIAKCGDVQAEGKINILPKEEIPPEVSPVGYTFMINLEVKPGEVADTNLIYMECNAGSYGYIKKGNTVSNDGKARFYIEEKGNKRILVINDPEPKYYLVSLVADWHPDLEKCNAIAKIYKDGKLIRTYDKPSVQGQTGWHLCDIKEGKFIDGNFVYICMEIPG